MPFPPSLHSLSHYPLRPRPTPVSSRKLSLIPSAHHQHTPPAVIFSPFSELPEHFISTSCGRPTPYPWCLALCAEVPTLSPGHCSLWRQNPHWIQVRRLWWKPLPLQPQDWGALCEELRHTDSLPGFSHGPPPT